jgi:HEAT repeat protein
MTRIGTLAAASCLAAIVLSAVAVRGAGETSPAPAAPAAAAKAAIPALVAQADAPDTFRRNSVGAALKKIGPAQGRVVRTVIDLLEDSRKSVRAAAAGALGGVTGDEAAPAIEALIKRLKDADPDVRKATAEALAQFGPAAKAAVQPLTDAMQKENITDVQAAMKAALLKIQPTGG